MKQILSLFLWLAAMTCAYGQNSGLRLDTSIIGSTLGDAAEGEVIDQILSDYIDTEFRYSDSSGKIVLIQNGLPKGGDRFVYRERTGGFLAPQVKTVYGKGVFWTRVVNETDRPLTFNLTFPSDSFPIPSMEGSYFKLFLPSDTPTFEKLPLYNYGIVGLEPFLSANLYKSSHLERIIPPGEACLFYVTWLIHWHEEPEDGFVRTGLKLWEEGLKYHVKIYPRDSFSIPCGEMIFIE